MIPTLGIHITETLKSQSHVTHIVKKAARITNWITRAFTPRRPGLYLRMYRAVVLPIIMYASLAWSPRFKKDTRRLQTAQNKFLRRFNLRTVGWIDFALFSKSRTP